MAAAGLGAGCGPKVVRGSDDPRVDEQALSTKLDRKDLDRVFAEAVDAFFQARISEEWSRSPQPPNVAIFPIANETSEHIDSALAALLSKFETRIVNSGIATVISREQQDALIREVERQRGGAFDPSNAALYGRQLGARYFVTGKVYDAAERLDDTRRVQYFLFLQCVDVETGAIRWQHEGEVTKAIVR